MRALVTGSTGFIGSHICQSLLEEGVQVRAFHRPSSPLRLLEGLEVEHVLGDLAQPESVYQAMQGVDVVFHAAAMLSGGHEGAGQMYTITVEGTRSVLQAARQCGVQRVVHTSSVAALGVPEDQFGNNMHSIMDETHTWNYPPQKWPYGYAKYLAEMEVQKAVAQGLDVVILNPTLVIGAGDVYRQTSSMVVQIARQRLPAIVEGGLNIVHIKDVTEAHLAALKYGKRGERYVIGGENLTIAHFAGLIAEIAEVPAPKIILPPWLLRFSSLPVGLFKGFLSLPVSAEIFNLAGCYFYYSNSKALKELRLPPSLPANSALKEAYEWFVQAGAIPKKSRVGNE
jgi:dihydroflavonol-4-reductase